ncbi:MAG: alpha/beta fold hydrolase [Spirochaetia bacterium]|nr:alpha/beta fold hydrolase [Spirochaetia bacterium]
MIEKILFHREFGGKKYPLIILHGLFGSSQNWISIARELSTSYHVFAIDLRNHGNSFHSQIHNLDEMKKDIIIWLSNMNIKEAVFLGHSMGGLVSMKLALENSKLVRKLIVADIAPKTYHISYENEFKTFFSDISKFSSRTEIDKFLEKTLPEKNQRQFIMTNIDRNENGYFWKINAKALQNEDRTKWNSPVDLKFEKPSLFIKAEFSDFISQDDFKIIAKYFIHSSIKKINNANHWLHVSKKDDFLKMVKNFLQLN